MYRVFTRFACFLAFAECLCAQAPGEAAAAPRPEEENRARAARNALLDRGVDILVNLRGVLEGVHDKSSADRAALQVYKITAELTAWGQKAAAAPALESEEHERTEEAYVKRLQAVNSSLEAQAQRLAAAEWFSSERLVRALALLVENTR
ncbi:MAG: hypothetical protein LIO63_07765 [Akkermansia sp.]|nr:hypothetical protein [Akkermansia sp.]MCD8070772.1 hypothetical protein [Akkermansiaceae bacterium]